MTTPYEAAMDRYRRDAAYHAFVDGVRRVVMDLQLTPSEAREATMLACIMVEDGRPIAIEVIAAPGDLCGNDPKRRGTCPGCRACR